jgi:hypothetical protein
VPPGRHHGDVVASFASWLGQVCGLEPFDLQVSDSSGTLSLRAPSPARARELCRRRALETVRRARVLATASTTLVHRAMATQDRSRNLVRQAREQRQTRQALRVRGPELHTARGGALRSERQASAAGSPDDI